MKKMIWTALALQAALAITATGASAIDEFREVTSGVYRGAMPGCDGLAELAKMGVRTIVNLDNRQTEIQQEKACADSLGLTWINAAMSAMSKPKDSVVNLALASLNDPDLRPVFVHCQFGQDRTGMIVGLFRVESQQWTPQAAYDEMLAGGYHAHLLALDRYYRKRTGM
jgi:protein tyrosine phosphatase (PTP) superfamily phosphohydrolase (DUF442 family)